MADLFKRTEQGVKCSRESWFGKIAGLLSRSKIEDSTWDELEELLIAADVGVSTTDKLLKTVKKKVKEEKLDDGESVRNALKDEIIRILTVDAPQTAGSESGALKVILLVGVNGSGKTTSIAKLANDYKNEGKKVILGAADTFRAGAIDQLKTWGGRIGVDIVAHQPGADPGAVVFDTLQAAQTRKADIVIIDTAGRLQTKHNLMDELRKIKKVADKYEAVQEVLLVLDATTGQNGLQQARQFTEQAGTTGIILAKLDGTAKGGVVVAIARELGLPIQFVGIGENVEDLLPFNPREFIESLFEN
jgi:fused signal recognition particle receptor